MGGVVLITGQIKKIDELFLLDDSEDILDFLIELKDNVENNFNSLTNLSKIKEIGFDYNKEDINNLEIDIELDIKNILLNNLNSTNENNIYINKIIKKSFLILIDEYKLIIRQSINNECKSSFLKILSYFTYIFSTNKTLNDENILKIDEEYSLREGENLSLIIKYILPSFYAYELIKENYKIENKSNLDSILIKNIRKKRLERYLKLANDIDNYEIAVPLLILEFEDILRNYINYNLISTIKINKKSLLAIFIDTDHKSIDSFIDILIEYNSNSFSEYFIKNYKILFKKESENGKNIRNRIAHGLVDDYSTNEFKSFIIFFKEIINNEDKHFKNLNNIKEEVENIKNIIKYKENSIFKVNKVFSKYIQDIKQPMNKIRGLQIIKPFKSN